ncbi:hypothetical protein ASZ90_019760 [hydrocarbon metagenome]|uniref:Flp family type IVb pilin n=1 Tax=hydrocarbon metagenome TaxID=938273 RepID=A0A0W8E3F9_9ZZZZ
MKTIMRLMREEDGQAVAEYAILVTVVSLITVSLFTKIGESVAQSVLLASSAVK